LSNGVLLLYRMTQLQILTAF